MRKLFQQLFGIADRPRSSATPLSSRTLWLALVVIALLGVLFWKLPQIQVRHTPGVVGEKVFDDEDEARKTLAQLLGGSILLLGLYFSAKTYGLSREGHLTDRFTKAIEQLGKTDGGGANSTPNIEVRLGAIYALERIAIDSPRDHWTIMEVLTAYVRQNAPLRPDTPFVPGEVPRTDVQAILTVLGRRRTSLDREDIDQPLDLTECRLNGASFKFADLQRAFFSGSHLQNARFLKCNVRNGQFIKSNLRGAVFALTANGQSATTNLQDADFYGANLERARLMYIDFAGAAFEHANLREASLLHASFKNTDLNRANLTGAKDITSEQIKAATHWQTALYSPTFRAELGLPPEPTDAAANPALAR